MKKNKMSSGSLKNEYGIGKTTLYKIYDQFGFNKRINDLKFSKKKFQYIFKSIASKTVGKELLTIKKKSITFFKKIKNYRGIRHKLKLPCRGQRTKTNRKTRKLKN